jgi:hypothetical protein
MRYPFNWVCQERLGLEYCNKLYDNFVQVYAHNFFRRISPNLVCPTLGFCSGKIVQQDFEEYKRLVLRDKPKRVYPTPSSQPAMHFLVFTDTHIDIDYTQVR